MPVDLVPRCPVCRSYSVHQIWRYGIMYYECRDCSYVFKWPQK